MKKCKKTKYKCDKIQINILSILHNDFVIFVILCNTCNFTKIDPSRIWLKIAGKVVIAISSNSTNKIGYF